MNLIKRYLAYLRVRRAAPQMLAALTRIASHADFRTGRFKVKNGFWQVEDTLLWDVRAAIYRAGHELPIDADGRTQADADGKGGTR